MGRVRAGQAKAQEAAKKQHAAAVQAARAQQAALDAAAPPSPPPPPSRPPPVDYAQSRAYQSFHPSRDTLHWLYTLPLPPGVTEQPLPQTPEDWALVEQYRLLCQGLLVMGEFERERRRRMDRGEDPWADWDPRDSNNPLIIDAAHSLFKHDLAQHAAGTDPSRLFYSNAYLHPSPGSGYPPQAYADGYGEGQDGGEYYSDEEYSYGSDEAHPDLDRERDGQSDYAEDEFEGEEGDDGVEILSTHTYDFPTLETLQSFASASPLDPSALPLSLDLSTLTLDGNALAGLAAGEGGGEGGPASLPSLMAAIAELEQCVARLSLEATEARNLQKSLRDEMSSRQAALPAPPSAAEMGAAGGMTPGVAKVLRQLQAQAAGPAGARRKVKGAKAVSVPSRSRLPPSVLKEIAAAQRASSQPSSAPAASPAPVPQQPQQLPPQPQQPECDCPDCLASSSLPPSPPAGAGGEVALNGQDGQQQKAWEDGELMKALQSVSMLDRRADEYRERLRVLKEQIHHHAALADALAAPTNSSAPSAQQASAPVDYAGLMDEILIENGRMASHPQAVIEGRAKGEFGQSASDTGTAWVSVNDRRRELAARAKEVVSAEQNGGR
ncbi:hypothetical protein JCM10213_002733 [Rhodosporidiobolus nylandii]